MGTVTNFKINQVIIHCLTLPRQNFIDLSRVQDDYRVMKQNMIVLNYPDLLSELLKVPIL